MHIAASVRPQHVNAMRQGLSLVRKVISANPHPEGLTTAEIFKLVQKEQPPAGFKAHHVPAETSITYGRVGNRRLIPPAPPNPEHPIKSMSFLKQSVLPILRGNKELKIVQAMRVPMQPSSTRYIPAASTTKGKGRVTEGASTNSPGPTSSSKPPPAPVRVWVWKTIDPSTIPVKKPAPPPRPLYGTEVGVGEDLGHLSKRRRRARLGKISRDVSYMRTEDKKVKEEEEAARKVLMKKEKKERLAEKAERAEVMKLRNERRAAKKGEDGGVEEVQQDETASL